MPKPPFHVWAKIEITRLREQADALQRALDMYQADDVKSHANGSDRPFASTKHSRVSKYEPLFRQFEQAGRSLTLDNMLEIAGQAGFEMDRNNMRSQVFSQKTIGRARPVGDGYVWASLDIEAAPSAMEDAA